jgi:hypothetical protein
VSEQRMNCCYSQCNVKLVQQFELAQQQIWARLYRAAQRLWRIGPLKRDAQIEELALVARVLVKLRRFWDFTSGAPSGLCATSFDLFVAYNTL